VGATLHPETKFLVIGTPGDVRVAGFCQALADVGLPPAEVIGYPQLLYGDPGRVAQAIDRTDWVRIEPPGRDPEAVNAVRGYAEFDWMDAPATARWQAEVRHAAVPPKPKGIIDRPWLDAQGLTGAMYKVDALFRGSPPHRWMNHPLSIASVCNKPKTCGLLDLNAVATPYSVLEWDPEYACYDAVRSEMTAHSCTSVFIKLTHGSAASGVVAYRFSATREQATTTVALHRTSGGVVLCNTRKIQRYEDPADVQLLLDTLCPMGVYVEQWVPKAGVAGRTADLRVVTIAGEPRHTVLRLSRSPITNLHLLNERADPALLREQMSADDWDAAMETCRKVARCFPQMLYLGIDLAVHADLRGHTVLEVNAFGDLLHGVTDRGQTTYEAELAALADWGARDVRG